MEWKREEALVRILKFKTFVDLANFVREVAAVAEELGHHPDMDLRYTTLVLKLTTHGAGNRVTEKDEEMAKRLDELINRWRDRLSV